VGTVMTKIAPLANAAAHNRFNRMLMEHAVGIHRDRQLPAYAARASSPVVAARARRAARPAERQRRGLRHLLRKLQ